ncbi:MAG: ANTAR domain-containing protein [Clostridia bacterium]|nr:ANTAR domain-containing protein [Clostridia bacterium]MBR1704374.1 ANTAR domain-containing protein [Clostridia bacterium]
MRTEYTASVMVVSSTDKALEFFSKILPKDQFSPLLSVHSAGEAQRELVNRSVDIVVINAPLKDEMGTELAIELAQNGSCGVMMMVKNDVYEQVTYKVEEYGVLTVSRPCTSQQVFQTMKLLLATKQRLKALEQKTASLEEKMKEIRLVNKAKGLLMDNLKFTEQEAHRYIEKAAMDNCEKKSVIAQNIINTYGQY